MSAKAKADAEPPADQELVAMGLLDAPRESVWRAFAEPEYFARWREPRASRTPFGSSSFGQGGADKKRRRIPAEQLNSTK